MNDPHYMSPEQAKALRDQTRPPRRPLIWKIVVVAVAIFLSIALTMCTGGMIL